eukprot:1551634-Pyramimonas_sp.AAC.1
MMLASWGHHWEAACASWRHGEGHIISDELASPSAFHYSQSAYSQTSEKHMPASMYIVDPPRRFPGHLRVLCE